MTFKKGDKKPENSGKTKGVSNKSTTLAREAIAMFIDNNIDKMSEWLSRVAEKDPDKAIDCLMKAMEYHIPKLARTEQSGNLDLKVTSITKEDEEILERFKQGLVK